MRKICKKLIFYGIMLGSLTHFVTDARGNTYDQHAGGYLGMFKIIHPRMVETIEFLSSSPESESLLPLQGLQDLQRYSWPQHQCAWARYTVSEIKKACKNMNGRKSRLQHPKRLLRAVGEANIMLEEVEELNRKLLSERALHLKEKELATCLSGAKADIFGLPNSIVLCQRSMSTCILHSFFNCLRFRFSGREEAEWRLARASAEISDTKRLYFNRMFTTFSKLLHISPHGDLNVRVQHVLDLIDGGFDADGAEGEAGVVTSDSLWDAVLGLDGTERICGSVRYMKEPKETNPLELLSQVMGLFGLGLENFHEYNIYSGSTFTVPGDESGMEELLSFCDTSLQSEEDYIVQFNRHYAFVQINMEGKLFLYNSSDIRIFDEEFAPVLSGEDALERMLQLTKPSTDPHAPWSMLKVDIRDVLGGQDPEEKSISFYKVVDLEKLKVEAAAKNVETAKANLGCPSANLDCASANLAYAKSTVELAKIDLSIAQSNAAKKATEKARIEETLQGLRASLVEVKAKPPTSTHAVAELEAELSTAEARLEEAEAELSTSTHAVAELEAELSTAEAKLEEAEAELPKAKAKLKEAEAELSTAAARLEEAISRLSGAL
jgi:hypothetical protein